MYRAPRCDCTASCLRTTVIRPRNREWRARRGIWPGTPRTSDPQQHAGPRISRISHQCEHRDRPRRGTPRAGPPDPSRTWPARRSRPGDRQRCLARSAPLFSVPRCGLPRQATSLRCDVNRRTIGVGGNRMRPGTYWCAGTARYRTTHGQAPKSFRPPAIKAGNDAEVRASRMSDYPDRAAEGEFAKAGLGNPARHITYGRTLWVFRRTTPRKSSVSKFISRRITIGQQSRKMN